MDKESLSVMIEKWIKEEVEQQKILASKYPDNVPNDVCKHAFIQGFSIENSFGPKVGEYSFFFKTNYEEIFVWTCEKNKKSALVSGVNSNVKDLPCWKTTANLITLALSLDEAFERTSNENLPDYKWMYYFDPHTSKLDDIVFYRMPDVERKYISNGRVLKALQIAELAPVLELLLRDDRAYTSLSLLRSAFCIHNICLICETSENPWHDHLTDEPEIWKQAELLPELEMAVVQSCRAVESILGEPPNKSRQGKLFAHKKQWIDTVGLDPDSLFKKGNMTYLEFYYELFFNLRNPSAHSYGNIHYDLARKRAVEAQCFAAWIVKAYFDKNMIDNEEALAQLEFNQELLSKVSENMSTGETKE